jgi:hypothetical protein
VSGYGTDTLLWSERQAGLLRRLAAGAQVNRASQLMTVYETTAKHASMACTSAACPNGFANLGSSAPSAPGSSA